MTDIPERLPLDRFMAKTGVGSRRTCERAIAAGEVEVNGVVTTDMAASVRPGEDLVGYRGRRLEIRAPRYYLLHKPRGYTCSNDDDRAARLAIELVPVGPNEHLFSVGRLDRDSEGLLLFTNDGELSHRLRHPRYQIEKTYQVEVKGKPSPAALQRLGDGLYDHGDFLVARSARLLHWDGRRAHLEIVMAEGKKHEIRRLCRGIGHFVKVLRRTRLGPLVLGDLKSGCCRELTEKELRDLRQAAGLKDGHC